MREILFKAKCKRTDKWVFGSLILPNTENENTYIQDSIGVAIKVHKETVSQFTGLTDKNGKNIFEGDILHSPAYYCIVEYEECGFVSVYKHPEDSETLWLVDLGVETMEIIGNIHDND